MVNRTELKTSPSLLLNFTVDQLKNGIADILSFYKGKLLIGEWSKTQVFIFSQNGRYISTITTYDNDTLEDVTWTPHGNIVYTAWISNKVVLMLESGKIITHTQLANPMRLSVSSDGIIYLADEETGVYQSADGGISWSLVFKSTDGCRQVIKTSTYLTNATFWTVERSSDTYYLRVYSVQDEWRPDGNVIRTDVDLNVTDEKQISLVISSLFYDDKIKCVFLSDFWNRAIHMFLVNGQHHGQLISSDHIKNNPSRLTEDRASHVLYIGHLSGLLNGFKLTIYN